jgi:hypothetical protein
MYALGRPDDAWPNYTGRSFTYTNDALVIAIDGLFFEVEAKVECRGMSDGLFEPLNFTIEDAYGNTRSFHYGAPDAGPLQVAVSKAIDREWDSILVWLCEQAEDE